MVSFDAVGRFDGSGPVTAQAVLHETGRIQIFVTSEPAGTATYRYTQGVESAGGTTAYFLPGRVQYTAPLMNDGVEFYTY